jgi:hypothetical protein
MSVSEDNIKQLDKILLGEGNSFTASVLRFINEAYHKADKTNKTKLLDTFPEEVMIILRFRNGWSRESISTEFYLYASPLTYFKAFVLLYKPSNSEDYV